MVELSIVLVILGLLTGGVLAGQSLIRAAQLRTIVKDYQAFLTASRTFRDKYFTLPGDMPNATLFWGKGRGTPDCISNSGAAVATPGTCDGNGNGKIDLPVSPWGLDGSGENYQFWRHLQLAGLVEGAVTGYSSPTTGPHGNYASAYAKSSKAFNAYWQIVSDFQWFGGAGNFVPAANGNNTFLLRGATANSPGDNLLTQSEMWSIDTKTDDGLPTSGGITANLNGWGGTGSCVTGPTYPTQGVYKLNEDTIACSPVMPNVF